jgi:hypothetical protein
MVTRRIPERLFFVRFHVGSSAQNRTDGCSTLEQNPRTVRTLSLKCPNGCPGEITGCFLFLRSSEPLLSQSQGGLIRWQKLASEYFVSG